MDYGSYPQHWLLFDRLVQQVVLQTSQSSQNSSEGVEMEDNDPIAPLNNLNVKEIVHQLGKESEISDLRLRAEELEKENIELATNLSKKEQVTKEFGLFQSMNIELGGTQLPMEHSTLQKSVVHLLGKILNNLCL